MSTSADERRLVQPLAAVLTAAEVMELLGLSPPTLRRLVKDGHLRAHRLPGGQNRLFRADEVLDDVSSWSSADEDELAQPPLPPPDAPIVENDRVDPTTIWCPAPHGHDGETAGLEECAAAWLDAARRSGLDAVLLSPTQVEVDALVYELRTGPRERVRVVDDDGEEAWQLIEAVWAEPASIEN